MGQFRVRQLTAAMLMLAFMITTLTGCGLNAKDQIGNKGTALASEFGTYREVTVNVQPSIKPYKVKRDLSNVTTKCWYGGGIAPTVRNA